MSDFLIRRGNLRETYWSSALPAPLADNAARLQVDAFALTSNNVTYAAFGEAMGYWSFFPAPDPSWGRVPVWGFATVIESKAAGVKPGTRVYGYLPISAAFDLSPTRIGPAGFLDGAAHRQGLAPIYNTYIRNDADPSYDPAFEAQQMLFRPLFTTGWMIDDCLMESGAPVPETVVVSSASSKTALALAHCLKQRGTVEAVALTSEANCAWVEATGLYARTVSYGEVDRLHARGLAAYVDFIGRPALTADVHHALKDRLMRSLVIGVTDWQASRKPVETPGPAPEFFFVPTYAAERAKALGADELNARTARALSSFYKASERYVTPLQSRGPDAIEAAWKRALDGAIAPDTGLILGF
jgi:NADPH:quinone reductase-like Zn-dependent oxidoreductase